MEKKCTTSSQKAEFLLKISAEVTISVILEIQLFWVLIFNDKSAQQA